MTKLKEKNYIEVRKLYLRVPASIFSNLERYEIMSEIDVVVTDFLVEEIEKRRKERENGPRSH